MNGFDHLEALAEQLIEGTFERLFRHRLHASDVARQLARAMEDGQAVGEQQILFPNQYWVFVNPHDFAALNASNDTMRIELTRYLQRLAEESGGRFGGDLRVSLHSVADQALGQIDVRAAHSNESFGEGDTQEVKAAEQSALDAERWSLRLGGRLFSLGEPVIRVGRALSNDVILDDQRVSRRHAQLRWRAGGYHLSDLGSSGGTAVNGKRVPPDEEVPLAAGDSINLGGVELTVSVKAKPPALDVSS